MSESMTAVTAAPDISSIVWPLPLPTSTTVTIALEQPHIASASVNTSLSSPVAQNPESTEAPVPASVLPPMTTASTDPSTAPPDILMAFNVPTVPDVVMTPEVLTMPDVTTMLNIPTAPDVLTASATSITSDILIAHIAPPPPPPPPPPDKTSSKNTKYVPSKTSITPQTQLVPNLCEVDAMPFNIGFACPLVLAMSQQLLSVSGG
ncbi:hypothetical protein PILCRDRAFT_13344 [Piloderma croceum F 1598]|uniref:Uncharacterized protein n=1 Tax=Piloderma croceum (strain F 1598) TaxID=765440 RepID=A0A0C3F790_PILCF|nr:hypothetical protein PILCRDRAFT_13344 [Piloderma croceum F 1598]